LHTASQRLLTKDVEAKNVSFSSTQHFFTMIKTAIGFFAVILLGSLLASLLGGLFAWLIATISPGFVTGLFSLKEEHGAVASYAFTVGMIWGLFIGAAVSGFACLLSTLLKLIRLRIEHTNNPKA